MNRASPVEMRKALEMVNMLKMSGILFVPIPVINEKDHNELAKQAEEKLESILQMIEKQ